MAPPTQFLNLDVEAISGICGSVSIACWVVVFSPQIVENFRRGSADGLSVPFVILWLLGDVFNILGAVLQGVLPTMIILAVYYTIADVVLLGQCFYYRGFTWRDDDVVAKGASAAASAAAGGANGQNDDDDHDNERTLESSPVASWVKHQDVHHHQHHQHHQHHHHHNHHSHPNRRHGDHHDAAPPDERTSLLGGSASASSSRSSPTITGTGIVTSDHPPSAAAGRERRNSNWSADLTHLSPAVPFVDEAAVASIIGVLASASSPRRCRRRRCRGGVAGGSGGAPSRQRSGRLQALLFNIVTMLMVCAAGVAGWWLSSAQRGDDSRGDGGDGSDKRDVLSFNVVGQIFGWFCAALYLGSRLPQLLLNWRRRSTEGVSMLFFLFACLGNLTYVLSILAFDPPCGGGETLAAASATAAECQPGEAARAYGRYMLVNSSWLAGSVGTLLLDMGIFVQFFLYSQNNNSATATAVDGEDDRDYYDDDTMTGSDSIAGGRGGGGGACAHQGGSGKGNGNHSGNGEDDNDRKSVEGEDAWDERPVLQRNPSDYGRRRS